MSEKKDGEQSVKDEELDELLDSELLKNHKIVASQKFNLEHFLFFYQVH